MSKSEKIPIAFATVSPSTPYTNLIFLKKSKKYLH